MSREKELVAAVAALLEVVSRQVEEGFKMDETEELAVKSAVELMVTIAQDCDECVDY